MSHKLNLVRVLTAATGTGTTITLGAAYSQAFMTPAESGAIDGRTYTALLSDGNNWELVRGAYSATGPTFSRTTVLASRSGGTLGTSRISLSGSAQVRFIESAEDLDGLRGTRAVTGTSDVIANTDMGSAITYSNASAIAATIAQAGASSQFLDGWTVFVKNTGAGALTITPATSTINGGASLVLAQNLGAMIWSDGSNYHAFVMPVTKPLLAANNLSDLTNAATARSNLGLTESIVTATVGHLPGIASNTAASTGEVGEVISASGTSGTLTSGTIAALGSISLTAGDWDISATIQFNAAGGTSSTDYNGAISTTSANLTPYGTSIAFTQRLPATADHSENFAFPPVQALINATTTFYLNARSVFTGTAPTASWCIRARRMR
ncbi:hypothetical protein [Bradyrhizobium sp. USDA 313]|uniref:hypothetical protein n=1 Tax=Bradyrhizobium sp. USDA 313 TaxID=3156307 RepID=UPI003511FB1D